MGTSALDWSQCPAVESIPGKVSGAWVFKDTRMPVATVFENLEAGLSVDSRRSNPASSAVLSNAPLVNRSHPLAIASTTTCP